MSTRMIRSEIAGVVLRVTVKAGERVEPGDELMMLESMKMELPVEAEASCIVMRLLVEQGQHVKPGDELAEVAGT